MTAVSVGSRLAVLAVIVLGVAVSVRVVTAKTGVFCENYQFSLVCGEAEKLKVRSAEFGRSNYFTCWNSQIYSVSCTRSVTSTMQIYSVSCTRSVTSTMKVRNVNSQIYSVSCTRSVTSTMHVRNVNSQIYSVSCTRSVTSTMKVRNVNSQIYSVSCTRSVTSTMQVRNVNSHIYSVSCTRSVTSTMHVRNVNSQIYSVSCTRSVTSTMKVRNVNSQIYSVSCTRSVTSTMQVRNVNSHIYSVSCTRSVTSTMQVRNVNSQIYSVSCTRSVTSTMQVRNVNSHIYSVSCTRSVTSTMQGLCDGQIKCSGMTTVVTFGDPCAYTYKYLTVQYDCEPMTTTTTTTTTTTPAPTTSAPPAPKIGTACDGTLLFLKCPRDEFLNIASATYGRMSNDSCGTENVAPCSVDATPPVQQKCQGKTTCDMMVSKSTLGIDPMCPPATYTYLEVNYTCESGGLTHVICENTMSELRCPNNDTVKILSASFGREDKATCPYGYMGDTKCRTDVTNQMLQWCDTKSVCMIAVHISLVDADPCRGTYKYVTIHYKCV
ncbi:hypothetical protein LSAT2_022236 [Lamellibrachia satsuma]|nr:hypothetical protein LSAT2_022236 [Lamellibrachia satsuma]